MGRKLEGEAMITAATGGNAFLTRLRRIDKRLLPAINSPAECGTVEKTRVHFGSFMQRETQLLSADQNRACLKVISSILRQTHYPLGLSTRRHEAHAEQISHLSPAFVNRGWGRMKYLREPSDATMTTRQTRGRNYFYSRRFPPSLGAAAKA